MRNCLKRRWMNFRAFWFDKWWFSRECLLEDTTIHMWTATYGRIWALLSFSFAWTLLYEWFYLYLHNQIDAMWLAINLLLLLSQWSVNNHILLLILLQIVYIKLVYFIGFKYFRSNLSSLHSITSNAISFHLISFSRQYFIMKTVAFV